MLNKTTTTTIVAVLITMGCLGFFYLSGLGASNASESTQTQINQGLFGLLMLVAGYYFGNSNKETTITTQPQQQMPTVFWDIQSLQDPITSINGQQVQYANAQALVNANQNYSIVQDNTGVPVLITNSQQVTLGLVHNGTPYSSTSVTAEFAGGRPQRPR